jgi:hypothetical protein
VAFTAMWAHGNSLIVESPGFLASEGHPAWGTELRVIPGEGTWLHMPLPTPVFIQDGGRAKLFRVFLLFETRVGGAIRAVHIFDGATKIFESPPLLLDGSHLGIDSLNTFTLPTAREVFAGINIAFFFQASIGFDTVIPPSELLVAAAGGDYDA